MHFNDIALGAMRDPSATLFRIRRIAPRAAMAAVALAIACGLGGCAGGVGEDEGAAKEASAASRRVVALIHSGDGPRGSAVTSASCYDEPPATGGRGIRMERPNHWLTRVADRVEKRVLRDPEKGEGATIVCASGVSPSAIAMSS